MNLRDGAQLILEQSPGHESVAVGDGITAAPAAPESVIGRLPNKHRQRLYVRLFTVISDVLAIVVAFVIANTIRFGDPLHSQAFNMLVVLLPIYLGIAVNSHAYSITCLVRARVGAANALLAFILTLSAISLVVFFLKVSTDFSRAVFGSGGALAMFSIPAARFTLAGFARRLFGPSTLNEVIIEDGTTVRALPGALVLNAERDGLAPRLDDPTMLDRLGRFLENADRVVVACPPERRRTWALALKGADVHAEVVAPEVEALGALGIERYGERHTLVIATGPLSFADRALKRGFDILVATTSLIVALPLMIGVAIAIRLDSPGPILFAQDRVGRGNRLFRMYKFRSMYVDLLDKAGQRSTSRSDDRVTRVGRFIRSYSLDELPQLFNVIRGDMSVVGPRPHALGSRAEDKLFWDIDLAYWHRHAVKPGLTGLAQVRGFRGATETVSDLSNRLQADLEYLSGWSIWRDVSILIATFRVLSHRNAF